LSLNCQCVILHADDDRVVPYSHGKTLLNAGLAARQENRKNKKLYNFKIDMISFHRSGYGHRLIYKAPNLIQSLRHVTFDENI